MENKFRTWGTPFPAGDKQLVYAPLGTPEADAYLDDMALGAEQAIATVLSSLSAPAMKSTETFGETKSFATPEAIEPAPNMLAQGISARSVQSVEQSTPASFERFAPKPQPSIRPPASGPNVYKPWN